MATLNYKGNTLKGSLVGPRLTSGTGQRVSGVPLAYKTATEDNDGANNGGPLAGVGYLTEKLGLGMLSGIEGIWDYTAGGVAKLFGADEWAEEQFDNDWVNYNHADEWYDPDDGWRFAGDVAGGIGSSIPSMAATIGVGVATGGAAVPAMIAGGAVTGLGAAGNATKEAYRQTGELGAREFGYGALSGVTEAGIEIVSGKIGVGTGRVVKSLFGKSAGKAVASTAGKLAGKAVTAGLAREGAEAVISSAAKKSAMETAKSVFSSIAKSKAGQVLGRLGVDYLSEGAEEAVAEFMAPIYQRWTYDPDAEMATAGEIAYAATVGGLSGLIMSGAGMGASKTSDYISGHRAATEGGAEGILSRASMIAADEDKYHTGYKAYEEVKSLYGELTESLKATGGVVRTVSQKAKFGALKRANAAATVSPIIERSVERILQDPERVAAQLSAFGMTAGGEVSQTGRGTAPAQQSLTALPEEERGLRVTAGGEVSQTGRGTAPAQQSLTALPEGEQGTSADGNALKFTAKDITEGIDMDLWGKARTGKLTMAERRTYVRSMRKAMTENSVLATLATMDATGHIMMDTGKIAQSIAQSGAQNGAQNGAQGVGVSGAAVGGVAQQNAAEGNLAAFGGDYSYDALTKQRDISIVPMSDTIPQKEGGTYDRSQIIEAGRSNARKLGNPKNTDTEIYVYVPSIGQDVIVGKKGLGHGLNRNLKETAHAVMSIGDLLTNSIAVNELDGRTLGERTTDMSYVLLAAAKTEKSPYLVRMIIDKDTNSMLSVSTYSLYAAKAKKDGALFTLKSDEAVSRDGSSPYLGSTISIADFLESVKGVELANAVLSEDVLYHTASERGRNEFGDSLRYALSVNKKTVADTADAVQDRAGNIYRTTLNIANGKNGKILYDINNIKKIDKKRTKGGDVPSIEQSQTGLAHSNGSSLGSIPQTEPNVNTSGEKYALSESEGGRAMRASATEPVGQVSQARGMSLVDANVLNYFIEHGSSEEKAALGSALGIDDWSAVTVEDVKARMGSYMAGEGGQVFSRQMARIRAAKAIPASEAKAIPHILRRNMADGVYRLTDIGTEGASAGYRLNTNMAVIKEGEDYYLFDYDTDHITMPVSVQQVNKLLREYRAVRKDAETRGGRAAMSDERYALSKTYISELMEWAKNGRPSDQNFVIGTTGNVLQGLGAIENDIYLKGDKINKILSDHPEITMEEIKKIPQIIDDPILVLKSKNVSRSGKQNTRLVLFGTAKAQNGQPILAVFDLRPNEGGFIVNDLQKVDSAYTKTKNPVGFIRSSEVMYASERKATALLRSIGFQMPIELNTSGFIGSISYSGRNVKLSGKKFSEIFTERYALHDEESGHAMQTPTVEMAQSDLVTDRARQVADNVRIDEFARRYVPEYAGLGASNRRAVRMTIRQAEAHGVSEAATATMARVAARSGLNIIFDRIAAGEGDAKISGGNIYLNPDALSERLERSLLLHEAAHAMLRGKKGAKLISEAFRAMDPAEREKIVAQYTEFYEGTASTGDGIRYRGSGLSAAERIEIIGEEVAARYIEDVLGDTRAWDYILSEEPTAGDKFLSFFRQAARDYAADDGLSSEARKLARTYKKLFDDLAARNRGNNAAALAGVRLGDSENTNGIMSDRITKIRDITSGTDGQAYLKAAISAGNVSKDSIAQPGAKVNTDGENIPGERFALPDSITPYSEEEIRSIESKKEFVTAKSYDDVLTFFEQSATDTANEAKTMFVGKIPTRTAVKIQKATNLNAFNKSIAISSHDIRHMLKEHGDAKTESLRGQEAISSGNFKYVIESIAEPDEVMLETDEKSGSKSVILKKEIDKKITAITVFSEKKKALTLKTAWITTKGQHISQPTNAEALIRTPEARSSMNAVPNVSIAQPGAKVNTDGENISGERFALPKDGKPDGSFVYSFSAEKSIEPSTRRTLHADVNRDGVSANAELDGTIIIHQNEPVVNPKDKKNTDERFALPKDGTPGAAPDAERYSYEALVKKPDMQVATLPEAVPTDAEGKVVRARVRAVAKQNARKQNNPNNTENDTYVYVADIDKHVRVNRDGLDHGLARSEDTALATMRIGDVLKNSIAVNELEGRATDKKQTDMSYVLLGIGQNISGAYLVRSIIDKNTNAVSEISSYGLYAVKAKKEGAIFTLKSDEGEGTSVPIPYLGSTISIADFLALVKGADLANAVFSEDVLQHFSAKRGRDEFGDSLRHALPVDNKKDSVGDLPAGTQVSSKTGYHASATVEDILPHNPDSVKGNGENRSDKVGYERFALPRDKLYTKDEVNERVKQAAEKGRERGKKQAYDEARREAHRAAGAEYQDRASRERQSRERTALKKRALRAVRILNRRLLTPTKQSNVHHAMQGMIADALKQFNVNTVALAKIEEYQSEIERLRRKEVPNQERIDALEAMVEDMLVKSEDTERQIKALRAAYDAFAGAADFVAKSAYDPDVAAKMDEFIKIIGETRLGDMDNEQLRAVSEFYEMLVHRVVTANETFAGEKRAKIDATAEAIIAEADRGKLPKTLRVGRRSVSAVKGVKTFVWNDLKPEYAFSVMGSDTLYGLYERLHEGELIWTRDVEEASDFAKATKRRYHWNKWDMGKTFELTDDDGKPFTLSVEQAMSLYAYSKRASAKEHLAHGGFSFAPDTRVALKGKIKGVLNDAERYVLGGQPMAKIAGLLTEEQRGFVDEMQRYLSKDMADKGNEVSRALYGIDLFTEGYYFPMKSKEEYLDSHTGQGPGDPKIKNKGMTKPTVPHATNPLILEGFTEVWSRHVNDMANYHGMVLPMEDMNRVLNYATSPDNKDIYGREVVAGANRDIIAPEAVKEVLLPREKSGTGVRLQEDEVAGAPIRDDQNRDDPNIEQSFGVRSINDYIGVQKSVLQTLTNEGFFENGNNVVTNAESGMVIGITKKGIKETLGSGNRFQTLTRTLKRLKLMTIRDLPHLIKTAHLIMDNQGNYHNPKSNLEYAYLCNHITLMVDGKESAFDVTITIRKSQQKNMFWVHEIRTTKKEQDLSHSEDGNLQQRYTKVPAQGVPTDNGDSRPVGNAIVSTPSKEEAPTHDGVVRPGGIALRNASSNDSIAQNGRDVKADEKKTPLKQVMEEQYGKAAVAYIEQLLRDLNGGVRGGNTLGMLDKLLSNFKKVSTMASLSVIIQQPTSLPRAFSEISPKYFRINGHIGARWAEVKRWAPIATLKDMGGHDVGTGQRTAGYLMAEAYKGRDKIKGFFTDKDYRDEVFGALPAAADRLTWVQIWEACKREQLDEYNRGRKGGEAKVKMSDMVADTAFMERVAKRFDLVIRRTQVYDSVLARSAHMRSKDGLSKMATAFMAEPTTVANMLIMAETKRARGEKGFGKIIGSVVAATIINKLLVSLVYAMRDDDEEKSFFERWVGEASEQIMEGINPTHLLTLFPIARDIVSVFEGYEVERSDMAPVADLYKSVKRLMDDDGATLSDILDFAGNAGSMFGVPARNIVRDTKAIYNTVKTWAVGERTTVEGIKNAARQGVHGTEISNAQQLYEAAMAGNSAQYDRVAGRYKDASTAQAALRRALRDNDKRVAAAAYALLTGDEATYKSTISAIASEGKISRADVIKAVAAEYNALKRDMEETGGVIFLGDTMYELTEREQAALEARRAELQAKVVGMQNTGAYKSLSEEQRDSALLYAETLIEDMALESVVGASESRAVMVASIVGVAPVAVLHAKMQGVTSDKDRTGKTVAGSKRRKVVAIIRSMKIPAAHKVLLLCSMGYSIQDEDIPGVSADKAKQAMVKYIASLKGVSQAQKRALLEMIR